MAGAPGAGPVEGGEGGAKRFSARKRRGLERFQCQGEGRAGQLLKEIEKAKGGGDRGDDGKFHQRSDGSTAGGRLADWGISKDQSSSWQKLADVPEDEFEAALAGPGMPTTSGIPG